MKIRGMSFSFFFFFKSLSRSDPSSTTYEVVMHQTKIDLILVAGVAVLAVAKGLRRKKNEVILNIHSVSDTVKHPALSHVVPTSSPTSEVSESHSVVSNSLWPYGLYSPWNSLGQNARVGSLSLLQGIFPIQGSNPDLLHCQWILCQLSYHGRPHQMQVGSLCNDETGKGKKQAKGRNRLRKS